MSSSERKMELESFVCELDKKIAEHEVVLKQKDIALKHAFKALREQQVRWKLHQKNRTHVKNKAEVVDFREYRGSEKLRAKSKGDLDDALFKVARLKSDVKHIQGKIEEAQADKTQIKKELAEYGQLIPFRRAV